MKEKVGHPSNPHETHFQAPQGWFNIFFFDKLNKDINASYFSLISAKRAFKGYSNMQALGRLSPLSFDGPHRT